MVQRPRSEDGHSPQRAVSALPVRRLEGCSSSPPLCACTVTSNVTSDMTKQATTHSEQQILQQSHHSVGIDIDATQLIAQLHCKPDTPSDTREPHPAHKQSASCPSTAGSLQESIASATTNATVDQLTVSLDLVQLIALLLLLVLLDELLRCLPDLLGFLLRTMRPERIQVPCQQRNAQIFHDQKPSSSARCSNALTFRPVDVDLACNLFELVAHLLINDLFLAANPDTLAQLGTESTSEKLTRPSACQHRPHSPCGSDQCTLHSHTRHEQARGGLPVRTQRSKPPDRKRAHILRGTPAGRTPCTCLLTSAKQRVRQRRTALQFQSELPAPKPLAFATTTRSANKTRHRLTISSPITLISTRKLPNHPSFLPRRVSRLLTMRTRSQDACNVSVDVRILSLQLY